MRKLISSVLCLVMLFSLSIPANAVIVDSSDPVEGKSIVLIYSNEASYEIVIPPTVTVDTATGKGAIVLDVTDTNLAEGTVVSVSVTSANYDNGWYLINTEDSSDKLAYKVGTTDGANDIASGDEVVAAEGVGSTTLFIELAETPRVGTFTDTLTFTSEIVSVLISFTVGGEPYQAVKGMTWSRWIASDYNVGDFTIYDAGHSLFPAFIGPTGRVIVRLNSNYCYADDVIMADMDYTSSPAPPPYPA